MYLINIAKPLEDVRWSEVKLIFLWDENRFKN